MEIKKIYLGHPYSVDIENCLSKFLRKEDIQTSNNIHNYSAQTKNTPTLFEAKKRNQQNSPTLKLTEEVHWMTSRQLSPSPATRRNHSPASLSLHNSCSKLSSFFVDVSSCLFTRIASVAPRTKRESQNIQTQLYATSRNNCVFYVCYIIFVLSRDFLVEY